MCFFSIITVVKNRKETIENTLSSVRFQTFKEFQYIVIDGQSDDGTLEVLKENSDIIDTLISEKDNSVYEALNKAISYTKGKYISILHSDDHYESKNVLEMIHNTLTEVKTDVLFASATYFKKGKYHKPVRKYKSTDFKPDLIKYGYMPPHTSMFSKKSVYSSIGFFNTKYKIAADFDWLLKLYSKKEFSIHYTGKNVINMNTHGLSNPNIFNIFKKLQIHNELYYIFRDNNVQTNWFKLFVRFKIKLKQLKL